MNKQDIEQSSKIQTNLDSEVNKFKSEISNMDIKALKNTIKKLNFLCLKFDPYDTDDLSSEIKNILEEYKLMETIMNPFLFTNKVLQILDVADNKLKELTQ